MMGIDEVQTPTDCIDIAIADSYDDEQIYCWVELFKDVFDEVGTVNISGEKVTFLGIEYSNDNDLAVIYKKNQKEGKANLDEVKLINPTKTQMLWIEGYNLWKSRRSF